MGKIFNPVKQWEVFNRCVRVAMQQQDVKTHAELAALMGMNRSVVSKRLSLGGWSMEEAWRLVRLLKIGPETAAVMMASVAA